MILGIPPRDDCLGDQRRFEEERDSKFSGALARKTKWVNFHAPRLRAACLIMTFAYRGSVTTMCRT